MNKNQELYGKLITIAAQIARRTNMSDPDEWPGWNSNVPQKLWKAAKYASEAADKQCADWAYELKIIADKLIKENANPD